MRSATFLIGERRAEIVALVHDVVGALAELVKKAAELVDLSLSRLGAGGHRR